MSLEIVIEDEGRFLTVAVEDNPHPTALISLSGEEDNQLVHNEDGYYVPPVEWGDIRNGTTSSAVQVDEAVEQTLILSSQVEVLGGIVEEHTTQIASLENFDDSAILASLDAKVDKQTGMGLSSNDFTDPLREKLIGLSDPAKGAALVAYRNGESVLAGIDSRALGGRFSDFLAGMSEHKAPLLLRKVSANRFEIFTPFVQPGRYCRWRFDNDEDQFRGAVPLDTAQGYTRPYLQTTVHDVFLEQTIDVSVDDAEASTEVIDIGNYRYVAGAGNYFEFTGVRATRLRCTVYKANNAGIIKVTINGSSLLVNLVDKDSNGDALIDLYDPGAAGASIMLAENLPDTDLTVRFEIVGKNPLSSAERCYLSDLPNPAALRLYRPYSGIGAATETVGEVLKLGGSAVDYAVSFRPDDQQGANTPFIGSVHGYEDRTAIELYLDNAKVDMSTLPNGTVATAEKSITLHQKSVVYHPEKLDDPSASASITWDFSSAGAKQGTSWKWLRNVFVTNGYTQMWTVHGGNQGGPGGPLTGWADRAAFRGFGSYPMVLGDAGEYGKHLTDEVLFYGSPYGADNPGRNPEAGRTACLVRFTDMRRSFIGFENQQSAIDGVWVQDRATFRKMYLQAYRAAGQIEAGYGFNGGMSVTFYKSPRLYEKLSAEI